MEIGATLARLDLTASDPEALARFYASTFKLLAQDYDGIIDCEAPGRQLRFAAGEAGRLQRASFRFQGEAERIAHRQMLATRGVPLVEDTPERHTVRDPLGHLVSFLASEAAAAVPPADARLQHFALRTPAPAPLAQFYEQQLGFVVSDRVLDNSGDLTAIFLRTDSEHHALALFRAPMTRFDHFSCEVTGWPQMREWADHMASVGVDLAWGIGRHGPGNDTFLMVRDPEGNMGEISAELEVCEADRPVGIWPHRPQTLNQWGVAIMRS